MKTTRIISVLILILLLTLSLISCKTEPPHEHSYASEWTVSETEHYKALLCDCEDAPEDKGEHIDEGNDGLCDVCSYDYGHTHTYSNEWTKTATEHFRPVSCGHNVEPADKGTHKDLGNDGVCDVCSYDYGHEHTYSVSWTITETEHYKAASCSHNIAPKDKGAHADENNDGLCDTCSYDYGHTHTYQSEWTVTATEHYKAASCGHNVAPIEKEEHDDPENDGVCNTCRYGSDHSHTYQNEWTVTETEHYKAAACGHTVAPISRGNHIDENNDKECDVCEYDYNHTHTYSDTLTYDNEGNHFYAPTCGCNIAPKDISAHTDSDSDCECDECYLTLHKPSQEWTKTADGHYKTCDCENAEHIANAGEHTDEDDDCECDTCGYIMHTHSDKWVMTDKEHHREASCGKDEHAADVGKHEDSDGDHYCDDCGRKIFNLPSVEF